jgi:hypothetical protein
VLTPVDVGSRRHKAESAEVAAAKALVLQLMAACTRVGYAGLDWAAGVFQGASGAEMVVMSNEGSGYVPRDLFVPRSARLLVADPLVDQAFRDRWFGWLDPPRVLVEYAKRRAAGDWTLVAAATSRSADALRDNNIPHALCTQDLADAAGEWPGAVLDEMHVHRLQLEYPDLYDRLARLADADPRLHERVIGPVARMLMDVVQKRDDYPQELSVMWAKLCAGAEPDEDTWRRFDQMMHVLWLEVGAKRPDFHEVSPDDVSNEVYRRYWLVSRALEVVWGWKDHPLPLADMVYAAAAGRHGGYPRARGTGIGTRGGRDRPRMNGIVERHAATAARLPVQRAHQEVFDLGRGLLQRPDSLIGVDNLGVHRRQPAVHVVDLGLQ